MTQSVPPVPPTPCVDSDERIARYTQSGLWTDERLSDWLIRHATATPEQPALVLGDTAISYAELETQVRRVATGLHRLDIGHGDIVAVQLPKNKKYHSGSRFPVGDRQRRMPAHARQGYDSGQRLRAGPPALHGRGKPAANR